MNLLYLISKLFKKMHIPAVKESIVHNTARVCSGSHIVRTNIGKYSYIGNFCTVINTSIGSFCSIADNCIIGGANHPIYWVSTSPVFHNGKNIMGKNFSSHEFKTTEETNIGNDVWIGNNCLIKSGVSISNGAVIGMGSVVSKDVGAYEIWAGNPAKLIRKRFEEDVIEYINESQWWQLGDNDLQEIATRVNNIPEFIKEMERYK